MILIADSGSTKTDWKLIDMDKVLDHVKTEGINPVHQRQEQIERIIQESDLLRLVENTKEIYFYGAGCNFEDQKTYVRDALAKSFPDIPINIEHDLLGAARALCGRDEGIAAILGTGSNSCYFNGERVLQNHPSLGYILGDEGSGVYMGKKLVQDYLYKKLPKSIADKFTEKYELSMEDILDNVYARYLPNRYLASFSMFIYENLSHPYIHGIVYESFYDFIDNHLIHYNKSDEVRCNFVGSIAYYYQDVLKRVVTDGGLRFGRVIKSPIDGLVAYHQNKI